MLSPRGDRGEPPEEGEIPDLDSSTDTGRLLIDEASPDPAPILQPPPNHPPPKGEEVGGAGTPKVEGVEENLPPPPKAAPHKSKKKKVENGTTGDTTPNAKRKRTAPTNIAAEKLEKRENGTCVRTVSSSTESELLGLAEPGTPICVEGCVFHEDASGFLVINVTWRGKSFVGTLLDSSRHDWAPPRPCESPPGEEGKGKSRSGKRGNAATLRRPPTANTNSASKARKASTSRDNVNASPLTLQTDEEASNDSAGKQVPSHSLLQPLSPVLLPCPCQHCHKEFHHPVALKYHQSAAHPPFVPSDMTPREIGSTNGSFQPVEPAKPSPSHLLPPTPDLKLNGETSGVKMETPERAASASGYSDISDDGASASTASAAPPLASLPPSAAPNALNSAGKPSKTSPPKESPKSGSGKMGRRNGVGSPSVGMGGTGSMGTASPASNPIPVIGSLHLPSAPSSSAIPTTPKTSQEKKREPMASPLMLGGLSPMSESGGGLFGGGMGAPMSSAPFFPPVSAYAFGLPTHFPPRSFPPPPPHHPFHHSLPPSPIYMGGPGPTPAPRPPPSTASPLSRK